MKKFFVIALLCFFQSAYAIEYEYISDSAQLVYSPTFFQWSQTPILDEDIVLTKVCDGYIFDSLHVPLKSNYQFIYLGRLIGVDNDNLKYYEIEFVDNIFQERELSYKEVQEIFFDSDILKISDFFRGLYTIINHSDDKKILLYNDTEQTFEDFIIYPDEYILNKNLKGLIKLPNRGKIIFYNRNTKNSTSYTIRVR